MAPHTVREFQQSAIPGDQPEISGIKRKCRHLGRQLRAACILGAIVLRSTGPAQTLPGHLDPTGPGATAPAALRTTDVPVSGRGGALGPTAADSLELAAAHLEVERAGIDVYATALWQRLIPRITLSASLGIGEVIFRDPTTDAITLLPRDSYRLTFSLGLDQLLRSPEHDHALVRLRTAELDAARIQIQISERQYTRQRDESATRQELALLADELGLVRQLVIYNEMLFAEGKAEFDALARAKLQLLSLSRVIAQVSQRLGRDD